MDQLPEAKLKPLKRRVLRENVQMLTEELGDLSLYLISLKSKGVLDEHDCEIIRARVTTEEKIEAMVNVLDKRRGKDGEASLDIFIEVLRAGRHPNLARDLQRALSRAMEAELEGHVIQQAVDAANCE